MSEEGLCRSCGKVTELRECIECGEKMVCKACTIGWVGNICPRCQQDNPVFFDTHSRTHGDTDPQHGSTR